MKFLRRSGESPVESQDEELPEGVLRDKKGRPLALLRGSSLTLEGLKEARLKYQLEHLGHSTEAPSAGEAFFFTNRRRTADYYSKGRHPNKERAVEEGGDPHIDKVYLIMKKPYVHDFKGRLYRNEEETYFNLIRKAKENGHDGVIFKNTFDGGEYGYIDVIADAKFFGETVYGVFSPDQILVQETKSLVSPKRKAAILRSKEKKMERMRRKWRREREKNK